MMYRHPALRVLLQGYVGLKRLNTAHFHSLQSTGNDAVKEREIVRHIHSDSMHRNPTSDVNADGRNLVSVHIHSRLSIDALALDSKHVQRVDNTLLKLPMIRVTKTNKAQVGM